MDYCIQNEGTEYSQEMQRRDELRFQRLPLPFAEALGLGFDLAGAFFLGRSETSDSSP
jgi:hypothetical protein